MGRLVDLFQLPNRDLRVNLGRIELGMTEHGLDVSRVGSIFEQRNSASMPHAYLAPGNPTRSADRTRSLGAGRS
jgi:hypothetical protein